MLAHEKIAYQYFQKLFATRQRLGDDFHRLNAHEQRKIRLVERNAKLYAGFFGALGVVFLYLPVHLKLPIFAEFTVVLPWLGKTIISWGYFLYMVFLAVAEIFALTWLNLVVVNAICRICSFPREKDVHYDLHIQTLFEVSLDKSNKNLLRLGINPMDGMSPYRIFLFSTLYLLKATLTNIFMKFLFRRLFSRLAIVGYAYYVDYMSILVFAGWNMYATMLMVREAKVRIMAPNVIYQLVTRLHYEWCENQLFSETLLETLQFIAVVKRNFHHNHYLLADIIMSAFDLPRQSEIHVERNVLIAKLKAMPFEMRQSIAKLFVLGMLVDGQVSEREIHLSKILETEGIWKLSGKQLHTWESDFLAGRGLDSLFKDKIPMESSDSPTL